MFEIDRFVEDCRAAVQSDPTHKSAHEVIRRALDDPAGVLAAVGDPADSSLKPIYRAKDLTILNVVWKPGAIIRPHNHQMWAVIGVYTGREDNIFWRRIKDDGKGRIEAAGADTLAPGDVVPLGKDIVHSVINPTGKFTGAIHVYGGDFFGIERSEWDPETLIEAPYDMAKTRAMFAR
jgi:predicted metal-dependent enzyme (double-stranded beta helix superfamily)